MHPLCIVFHVQLSKSSHTRYDLDTHPHTRARTILCNLKPTRMTERTAPVPATGVFPP